MQTLQSCEADVDATPRLARLPELAHANGLALTEVNVAVERLVAHGELIRRGNRYRRPVGEERGTDHHVRVFTD